MSLADNHISEAADILYAAQLSRQPISALTGRHPTLSVAQAYAIQRVNLARPVARGAVVRRHKNPISATPSTT